MASSTTISDDEFKAALSRYPDVLSGLSKPPKEGALSLEELDKFRYQVAPSSFSKSTGRTMELKDVQKLLEWKMKHGQFRPALARRLASNSDAKVAAATKDAFDHYAANPTDIKGVLEKLSKPLNGVGPATSSLLLSIHDPANVVFFSDQLYRWLIKDGEKASPKYTVAEFEDIFKKSKEFMNRIHCTPIELEKVAFTIIQENEPVHEPAPKKLPNGKPRGRPAKPAGEKKVKPVSTRGPGRPPRAAAKKATAASTPVKKTARAIASPKPRSVGRPKSTAPKSAAKSITTTPATGEPKKRGRPPKVKEEEPTTPASKKRGRPSLASTATSSNKKQKI